MKILVVGGSGGIGAAVTALLSADGHKVFFTYRLSLKKAQILEKETGAKKIQYDFSSEASIAHLLKSVDSEAFDGLVYLAAEKFTRENILKLSAKAFLECMDQSVRGYYEVSQAFASAAKKRKGRGVIVNMLSSVVLGLPPAKQAGYVCAKYALLGLTKCQAVEFGLFDVRVNSVSPSMTQTSFNSDLPERFIEMYAESLPLRRLAAPAEVAHVIRFLVSPEASYLQGVNIPVSGGTAC